MTVLPYWCTAKLPSGKECGGDVQAHIQAWMDGKAEKVVCPHCGTELDTSEIWATERGFKG